MEEHGEDRYFIIDINVNNICRTHVKIKNHGEDRIKIGPRLRPYNNYCWIAGWSGILPQVCSIVVWVHLENGNGAIPARYQ